MSEIQKIQPSGIFTNYIYKAIPLAFDESMSYYETLCGVLDLLKTTTGVVNNNAELLAELESYVKNYFDNLDVQDEINNKLDEMATNGQLQPLINDIFRELNTKINRLASGSPSGEYNTYNDLVQDNPNHDNIYVVSDNGYWYYCEYPYDVKIQRELDTMVYC